jgi:hypothetical protein
MCPGFARAAGSRYDDEIIRKYDVVLVQCFLLYCSLYDFKYVKCMLYLT